MTQLYLIDIYNVRIIIKTKTEAEWFYMKKFKRVIETEIITIESICKWCILHHVQYEINFRYYQFNKNTISKIIKYLIQYIAMKKRFKRNEIAIDE